jgi:hypothetical protein
MTAANAHDLHHRRICTTRSDYLDVLRKVACAHTPEQWYKKNGMGEIMIEREMSGDCFVWLRDGF